MAIRCGFHDEVYAIVDLVSSKALEDIRVVHSRYSVNVWTLYVCMFLLLELFTAHLMACLDHCDSVWRRTFSAFDRYTMRAMDDCSRSKAM